MTVPRAAAVGNVAATGGYGARYPGELSVKERRYRHDDFAA
jgi:hypothetical protein